MNKLQTSVLTTALLLLPLAAYAQQVTGIWVGNQGNFSDHNGSVTFYDPGSGEASAAIENFGTLVQSLALHKGSVYVVSNTSGALDILDAASRQRTGQVRGLNSPRYMAVASESKAYVSSLWANQIYVVDLASQTVVDSVAVGSNPEDIAVVAGRAYVANSGFGGDSTLSVIDTSADTLVATLDLGCDGPRHLEVDAEEELWVFCNGNTVYNDDFSEVLARTNGAAVVLDGATGQINTRIELASQVGAATLGQDTYYSRETGQIFLLYHTGDPAIEEQYLVFATATNELVTQGSLTGEEAAGAIAYDARSERFYVARITDFTSAGFVSVHGMIGGIIGGAMLERIPAGIAPAHILLEVTSDVVESVESEQPHSRTLGLNFPNPFGSFTTIPFTLSSAGQVRLTVYDMLGRVQTTLVDGILPAGEHQVRWDSGKAADGVYFVRLESDKQVSARQIIRVE